MGRGVAFREQPGVRAHRDFMARLHRDGVLLLGGPFLDDSGGLAVVNLPHAEAQALAATDPGVRSGLLQVTVRPWLVPMSRVSPCSASP